MTKGLDEALDKHNIVPQAYHSRSFIGNHCHKYMNENVYTSLTKHVYTHTMTLTNNQQILGKAETIRYKFDSLNKSFSASHSLISHSNPINPPSHTEIRKKIDGYMTKFRNLFPQSVTPKQHILEHHSLPVIKKWGFGLGLLGEQGGEMVHASIAKIERRTAGIRYKPKQLKAILEAHRLQTASSLNSEIPPPKKKKTKKQ